jgi:hypothetical protein
MRRNWRQPKLRGRACRAGLLQAKCGTKNSRTLCWLPVGSRCHWVCRACWARGGLSLPSFEWLRTRGVSESGSWGFRWASAQSVRKCHKQRWDGPANCWAALPQQDCSREFWRVGCGVWASIVYQPTPRDPLVLAGIVLARLLPGLLATGIPSQLLLLHEQ